MLQRALSPFMGASRSFSAAAALATEPLKRTALFDLHVEFGGRMVNFAGWNLPVMYQSDGIMSSHLHTRSHASLFDVSHMGQVRITGENRVEFLEKLVVGDIKSLGCGEMRLSLLTNESGGIIDDTIVTAQDSFLSLVINGACREKDMEHFAKFLKQAQSDGMDVDMELQNSNSLIALQGPDSMDVLQSLVPSEANLTKMPFMTAIITSVDSIQDCTISRCGYTGEDGFEISVANDAVEKLVRKLASHPVVKLAGLGARDSLRLESGFCLYGHDLDEATSPIEAALGWTIGKRRRLHGGYLGAEAVSLQLQKGVHRKRIGIIITDKAPPKEGAKIFDADGEEIGVITSSVFSPSLQRPIAMGYVLTAFSKAGMQIKVDVRGKLRSAEVVKMPFVAASFYKVP